MNKIDFSSKRAQLAIRFFTYGVMTIATVALTFLAIFYAMGYRFNQKQLTFEQGGLIQLQSVPESAKLVIDGETQSFDTPGRSNEPAGQHTVEMQLNGYIPWKKTFELAAGQLLWLNYARLIPQTITTNSVRVFNSLNSAVASPDHRWMLLQEKANKQQFVLADFDDEKTPKFTNIAIPDNLLTKKRGHFGQISIVEWDLGSRYVLVQHVNGITREFIRLDTLEPEESINLSKLFSLNIKKAHFAGTNSNIVYVKTDDVLRRLDINNNSASAALITGIKQFTIYGDDTVAYVAERETKAGDKKTQRQIIGIFEDDKENIIRTLPVDKSILIAYAEYFRDKYLAFTLGDGTVQVLRNPVTDSKSTAAFARFKLDTQAKWLKFSNNGRMLTAGRDNSFNTYDLELNDLSSGKVNGDTLKTPLAWLDDYYLWSDAGGHLRIFEFDGNNDHEITSVAPGFGINLSQNGEALFSIAKDDKTGKFKLQSSGLVINQN